MKKILVILIVLFPLLAIAQSKQSDEYYTKGVELYNAGKYKQAIPYFEKSNELDMQEMEEGNNRREYSIHWLASCYYKLGIEDKAAELYPDEYLTPVVDRRLTVESDALSNQAIAAYEAEDYQTAIGYLKRMIQIEKAAEGEEHPWVANDYFLMGCCLVYTGNYKDGEKYTKLYVDIYEKNYGNQSIQYAKAINELAILYSLKHDYNKAIYYEQKSSDIFAKKLGKQSYEYMQTINYLAIYYSYIQNNEKAVKLQQEVLSIMNRLPDIEESDVIACVKDLATYLHNAGRYNEAIKQYGSILARAEKIYGKNSAEYASALSNMAEIYNSTGDILKAIELEQQALNILEKSYNGTEEHIWSLMHFYEYYIGIGYTIEAKNSIDKAFEIIKNKNVEKTSQYYLDVLERVIIAYSMCDETQYALQLAEEKNRIIEAKCGKDSPDYLNTLCDYATLKGELGDNEYAINTLEHTIEIMEKNNIPIDPLIYSNIANFLQIQSDYAGAAKYMEKCTKWFYEQKDTVSYVKGISFLAMNQMYAGNWNTAYDIFTDSIITNQKLYDKIIQQTQNKNAKNITEYMSLMTDYRTLLYYWLRATNNDKDYRNNEFYESTKQFIQQIDSLMIDFYLQARGDQSPEYIQCLYDIATAHIYLGDYTAAENNIPKWYNWTVNKIRTNFATMSSQERFVFQQMFVRRLGEELLFFPYKNKNSNLVSLAYDGQLFIKGLSINAELEIQDLIEHSGNKLMKDKYLKIKQDRAILDRLYQIPRNARKINADSLQNEIEKLEKELVTSSKEIGDYTRNLSISWQSVLNKLNDNDLAIEFGQLNGDDTTTTIALILKKGMSSPEMVTLFTYRDLGKISPNDYYTTTHLYNLVWQPLQKYLKGVENVYFAPSGKFHTIGIEYLPDDSGEIFAQKYNAYRLSSTRELVLPHIVNPNKNAAVYGGLVYDFGRGDWQDLVDYQDEIAMETSFRDLPDVSEAQRAGITFLQGAKAESDEIVNILRNNKYLVSQGTGVLGTETSFKKLSGSGVKILHIATHGFYEPENKEQKTTDFLMTNDKSNKEDNSLSRSGLFLAGASSALDPDKRNDIPEGVDDGILTAKEISRLDFKGLDLVVLSACQTGLGEVTSEGVFGLQRGFKKAGAQTIVMSLWSVDDNATKDLMTEFYKNLVGGKTKRKAFISAQEFLRNKYQDPRKWAAFVMVDGI